MAISRSSIACSLFRAAGSRAACMIAVVTLCAAHAIVITDKARRNLDITD